ncbi:putative E3 ubiquitin ligase containing RING finger [Pseudoloma neurophilia]|uniref:RNA polymerase II transcription factor B subunit 3 n=1 Tax=Pseudoloma neurophilia TaxID=146866 RepID=A0A0R0M532_9MICR|nr:putative E3 ubiquitin ligase containing RING finger [Pseudoloma neurophilia]
MDDQLFCPQCKSDSYLNPNIKIFVSPCYHKMCDNCLSRIFSSGESGCPECGTILRKTNFTSQTFEDMFVERECRIRRILTKVFNKKEEDFSDEELFEDYNELFEDTVVDMMELKNDLEVLRKVEILRQNPHIYILESSKKKKKPKTSGEATPVQEIDPLEGVIAPSVILKKPLVLPKAFQFEDKKGGYTKRITAYRAVYSLMDDNI